MEVTKETLFPGKIRLTVSVPSEKYKKYLLGVALELSERGGFPGFRPGHVPYDVIKSRVGEATLLNEALEGIVKETYL